MADAELACRTAKERGRNRVEVYGVAAVPGEARSQAFSRLGSHRGIACRELEPLLYTAT